MESPATNPIALPSWMLEPRHLAWLVPLSALPVQAAYPPLEWAPLAWVGFVPLLALMEAAPGGTGLWFGLGWGWGLVHNAAQHAWLPEALLVKGGLAWDAFIPLVVGGLSILSLYPAAAIALARGLRVEFGLPLLGTFPPLWAAQDALLGVTPFGGAPWGSLAGTQTEFWIAALTVPVVGGSGLVLLIAALNSAWSALLVGALRTRGGVRPGFATAVILAFLLASTIAVLVPSRAESVPETALPALIVPGDVPIDMVARSSRAEAVLRGYLSRSLAALSGRGLDSRPVLVIWPESAVPGSASAGRTLADLFDLSATVQADFLFGSNAREFGRIFNSAYLVTGERFETRRYDKMRLVPFGEYVPAGFRAWFGKKLTEGDQDYSPGRGPPQLSWRGHRLGLAICFESILPAHARRAALEGAEVLIALSNDQWLTSSASRQHLRLTALRSLESGREALVAANGGWSAHLRGGRIRAESPPGGAALNLSFAPRAGMTPWVRWGYGPLAALASAWLACACAWTLRARFLGGAWRGRGRK